MCKFDHSLLILHKNFENSDCSMYAICGGLGKFCSQFALFTEKFTRSTKILCDRRSRCLRQISCLSVSGVEQFYWYFVKILKMWENLWLISRSADGLLWSRWWCKCSWLLVTFQKYVCIHMKSHILWSLSYFCFLI